MLLCLHVEFVFMLMPFTWLTDDLLKDNPPSKLRLSISAAQICLFCEKYENPRNLGIVRACADKSHLCCRLWQKAATSYQSTNLYTDKFLAICGVVEYLG